MSRFTEKELIKLHKIYMHLIRSYNKNVRAFNFNIDIGKLKEAEQNLVVKKEIQDLIDSFVDILRAKDNNIQFKK